MTICYILANDDEFSRINENCICLRQWRMINQSEKKRSKFWSSILPYRQIRREWKKKEKSVYLVSSTNVLNKENNSTHEINLSLYIRKKRKRTRGERESEGERRISCVLFWNHIHNQMDDKSKNKYRTLSIVLYYNLEHCFTHSIR